MPMRRWQKINARHHMMLGPRPVALSQVILCYAIPLGSRGNYSQSGMAPMKWLLYYLIATILLQSTAKDLDIVHINRLKAWKTPTANLFQVVAADEFEVNPEPIGKVKMDVTYLTKEQRLELDRRLAKFSDRVTHTLGVANFEENDINVKEGYPLRTRPYCIAPGMFDDLKGEIDDLISKGIIVPSRSPWSAPMVPLRKKSTGHVRLCIDYRRLNKITIPDPYQMPCIEDSQMQSGY